MPSTHSLTSGVRVSKPATWVATEIAGHEMTDKKKLMGGKCKTRKMTDKIATLVVSFPGLAFFMSCHAISAPPHAC